LNEACFGAPGVTRISKSRVQTLLRNKGQRLFTISATAPLREAAKLLYGIGANDPVRLDASLQGLIDPGLIGAERATSLEDEDDLARP
jgi:hypothetical protein